MAKCPLRSKSGEEHHSKHHLPSPPPPLSGRIARVGGKGKKQGREMRRRGKDQEGRRGGKAKKKITERKKTKHEKRK